MFNQPSQGADGESEFGDDAVDEDELMSEEEEKPVCLDDAQYS